MSSITFSLGDITLTIHGQPEHDDPLDKFEGPQKCCGDQGDNPVENHSYVAAFHLAQAAQSLSMAYTHVEDIEILDMKADIERLTAEYLVGAN